MNKVLNSLAMLLLLTPLFSYAQGKNTLDGLWASYKRFGPQVQGPLLIDLALRRADVGGYVVNVVSRDGLISFQLPGAAGQFVGRKKEGTIQGHWIQPPPLQIGQRMASPVVFDQLDSGIWQAVIRPRASEYTLFLPVKTEPDGTITTFLRNPDRNLGLFGNVRRIEQNGRELSFIGGFFNSAEEQQIAQGSYDEETDVLTLVMPPWRGGTYDFERVTATDHSSFYAAAGDARTWRYRSPPQIDDGWTTATLENVGLDVSPIRRMIEDEILTLDDNISSHRVHGVLIARHGKLVLEEYFHGFDRNTPHDTRSASKSIISMMLGAAALKQYDIGSETSVYETLRKGGLEEDPLKEDPLKEAMTLRHLLTMSSGLYCDDNDSNAPGNENILQGQTDEPNWYKYTLDLPMAEAPGQTAIYCSANSNLIGAVVSAATEKTLLELFADLIATPLEIKDYYLGLQPTGEPYFGGGAHFLPRDFMKIGQVMLNKGTWNRQRLLSEQWANDSTKVQVNIGDRGYGYQWWINEYPYGDGTVRAFFAAGNGGQIVMGVPELDLLIAFYGGNYSDAVMFRAQNVLIPEYLLKAVR